MDLELLALMPAVLAVLGSLLGVASKIAPSRDGERQIVPRISSGARVLLGFAVVVLCYGAFVVFKYWQSVVASSDLLVFAGGLLLAMIAGMFVQVLAANYRAGLSLGDVSASQLVFPLLFSFVLFIRLGSHLFLVAESFLVLCGALKRILFGECSFCGEASGGCGCAIIGVNQTVIINTSLRTMALGPAALGLAGACPAPEIIGPFRTVV